MKKHLRISILMTLVTTVIFGLLYPLAVTGLGQLFFPAQANGGMITPHGQDRRLSPHRPAIYCRVVFSSASLRRGQRLRSRCT